jgi:aspartate/methionine/tyrosine aminotransferase
MLSRRIQDALAPSPLYQSFSRALSDAYHPTNNPNGIISLGIAENTLMYNRLAKFLDESMTITPDLFGYSAVAPGPAALKAGLLRLYNSPAFSPVTPVEPNHLFFTAGCTALLDELFWTLCDEGDGVLIGKPLYGGFVNDMQTRAKVKLIAVSLKDYDAFSKEAVVRYEEELQNAEKEGIKVRALVLCTPHNPLGQYTSYLTLLTARCYPRETMVEYMRLCQKYQIHLVSDEIYALTTFPTEDIPNPTPFTSLLSIPKGNLIDPSLCHVLHGMSKVPNPSASLIQDFCANGVRFAILITQANPTLLKAFAAIG